MSLPASAPESHTAETVNEALTTLSERLQAAGVARSGPFWTTLTTDSNDQIAVMYCWSVSHRVPDQFGDQDALIGEPPERLELVATWRAPPGLSIPDGTTHPAVVALLDALTDENIDLKRSEVRQSIVVTDEDNYSVEVAMKIREFWFAAPRPSPRGEFIRDQETLTHHTVFDTWHLSSAPGGSRSRKAQGPSPFRWTPVRRDRG